MCFYLWCIALNFTLSLDWNHKESFTVVYNRKSESKEQESVAVGVFCILIIFCQLTPLNHNNAFLLSFWPRVIYTQSVIDVKHRLLCMHCMMGDGNIKRGKKENKLSVPTTDHDQRVRRATSTISWGVVFTFCVGEDATNNNYVESRHLLTNNENRTTNERCYDKDSDINRRRATSNFLSRTHKAENARNAAPYFTLWRTNQSDGDPYRFKRFSVRYIWDSRVNWAGILCLDAVSWWCYGLVHL